MLYLCRIKQEKCQPNLWVGLVVVLLCSEPSSDHLIFDGESQSEVVIAIRSHVPVFDHCIVQMPVKRLLHAAHRSLLGDLGYTDAPAILRK